MARELNPASQGQDWLVLVHQDDRRMMSTREVRAGVHGGTLARETLVWRAGMDAWATIGSIAELASQNTRPTVPRGRMPGGYNPRFAETVASNHRMAQQSAAQRTTPSGPLVLELVSAGAAALLTIAATSYALYAAGVFRAGSVDTHVATPGGATP